MRVLALLRALGLAAAATSAQAQADTVRSDSARVHALPTVVVAGARLGPVVDVRLPVHVVRLPVSEASTGAAPAVGLLRALPGASMTNDQGTRSQPTLDLRGFNLSPVVGAPQGVSVFLDGVRVNEPDAQEVNLDLLPVDALESADLVPGPSAIFGKNSLAGALLLRTRRGDTVPELRGAVTVGSYGERAAHVSAGGVRGRADGFVLLRAAGEDGYQAQSGAATRLLFATLGRRSVGGDVSFSVLRAADVLYEAGSLPERWLPAGRRANYTGGDAFRPDLAQAMLHATHATGATTLRASVFARRNRIEQFNANVSDPDTRAFVRNSSAGLTMELVGHGIVASMPVDLTVGIESQSSRVGYRVLALPNAAAPTAPDDCAPEPGGSSALCEDVRVRIADGALYAQSIWTVTPRLSFLLAARGDWSRIVFADQREPANNGTSTFARVLPTSGLTWTDGPRRIYGSIGSAFRVPAALELACASATASCPLPFSLGADPPLRPVIAWNYEGGAEWTRKGRVLSVSVFRTNVRDEIAFVSSGRTAGYFQNLPRTQRAGVEVSGGLPLPLHGARLAAGYTLVDATYGAPAWLASALGDDSVDAGSRFALSPRHRAQLSAEVTRLVHGALANGAVEMHAVSSSLLRGDEADRRAPLAGYTVVNARFGWRNGRWAATVRAQNLLDRRYSVYGVYAENPKGSFAGPAPDIPAVEPFVTPAYPRTMSVTVQWALE